MRGLSGGFGLCVGVTLIMASWSDAGFAQKLVDPSSVAPEYREAAKKRRAEQLKMIACGKKADEAKVLPRDRAAFITPCLEN
jgi:hypothetical protein